MSALALLLVMVGVRGVPAPSSQAEAWARHVTALKGSARSGPPFRVGTQRGDTVPPYLAFPETRLDDPAAYEGYTTRVYRDAAGNAFQVYVKGSSGRVVNLWADAADESVGFTVRDSTGRPARCRTGSTRPAPSRSVSSCSGRCGWSATCSTRAAIRRRSMRRRSRSGRWQS